MTEDDTFRVLKQMPFEELRKIAKHKIMEMDTPEEAEEFFLKFGWTFDEFYNRIMKL